MCCKSIKRGSNVRMSTQWAFHRLVIFASQLLQLFITFPTQEMETEFQLNSACLVRFVTNRTTVSIIQSCSKRHKKQAVTRQRQLAILDTIFLRHCISDLLHPFSAWQIEAKKFKTGKFFSFSRSDLLLQRSQSHLGFLARKEK